MSSATETENTEDDYEETEMEVIGKRLGHR